MTNSELELRTTEPKDWLAWLPPWTECDRKHKSVRKLSALEQFILDNEPAGLDEDKFREQLAAVIAEAYDAGKKSTAQEEDPEPPDPDGECFRGKEYASALAEQQAQAKRLK